jgi:rare lipoprotein A (peptidoglycan hydrolase)
VVTIHASNGNTATCVVTDRGPFGPGRIIDLDRGVFAQLTSPGAGVIAVTITW